MLTLSSWCLKSFNSMSFFIISINKIGLNFENISKCVVKMSIKICNSFVLHVNFQIHLKVKYFVCRRTFCDFLLCHQLWPFENRLSAFSLSGSRSLTLTTFLVLTVWQSLGCHPPPPLLLFNWQWLMMSDNSNNNNIALSLFLCLSGKQENLQMVGISVLPMTQKIFQSLSKNINSTVRSD